MYTLTQTAKLNNVDPQASLADVLARVAEHSIDPLIWLQIEVPTSISSRFCMTSSRPVMGWFDCHLWEFTIAKQRYGLPMEDDWGNYAPDCGGRGASARRA
jgi:IS66 C-terminal element/Plasmid pRiA4b ORF-3-like protein